MFNLATQSPAAPALAEGVSNAEVCELANGVIKSYRADVVSLACLMQLTKSSFKQFTGVDMSKLLELQKDCVAAFMLDRGIEAAELGAATAALERAGRTAEYLNDLPA
jgi:hypothetical protein